MAASLTGIGAAQKSQGFADECSHACGQGHGQYSPKSDAYDGSEKGGTSRIGGERTQDDKKNHGAARNCPSDAAVRHGEHDQQWHRGARGKGHRRGECSLHGAGTEGIGYSEFVTGMRAQGVFLHQLRGHLVCKHLVESTLDIDGGELRVFVFAIGGQLDPFALQIGPLCIGLGTYGDILSGSHRHGACHESGDTGDKHTTAASLCCRNANNQAGRGEEAVICTQDRSAQPSDPVGEVKLGVFHGGNQRAAAPIFFTSASFRKIREIELRQ